MLIQTEEVLLFCYHCCSCYYYHY